MSKPEKTTKTKATVGLPAPPLAVVVPFTASTKYAQREIHMRLDTASAVTLRSIFEALEEKHAKTDDGHVVRSPQDAIRWLLEEVRREQQRRPAPMPT